MKTNASIRHLPIKQTGSKKYGIRFRHVDEDSVVNFEINPNEISDRTKRINVRKDVPFTVDPVFEPVPPS